MDIFDLLSLQHKDVRQKALEKNWQRIRKLREEEALSASLRAAELQAIEDERQRLLQQRLRDQQRQERRLLALVGGAAGLFILFLFLTILYTIVR